MRMQIAQIPLHHTIALAMRDTREMDSIALVILSNIVKDIF